MEPDVRAFLERFARHLVARDHEAAAALLAPWTPGGAAGLAEAIRAQEADTRAMWHDMDIGPADTFDLDENPLTAEELREEDVPLPPEIDARTFAGWYSVAVGTEDGPWALYDLWCAVVRAEGGFRVGYFEVEPPD